MSGSDEKLGPAEVRRSRTLRRLVPRFGIGWLFVSMLLLISAAGWWKFHRDLYVEEIEVIRSLRNNASSVGVGRGGTLGELLTEEIFDGDIPWNAPLLPPVERLYIEGELPNDVRDAAARLPRVRLFRLDPARTNGTAPTPVLQAPFDFEAHLGRALPEAPASTLSVDSVSTPLPNGERVDADEAARISDAIYDAWHDDDATPSRILVVSRSCSLSGPAKSQTVVQVMEPDRRFLIRERDGVHEASNLLSGLRHNVSRGKGGVWRLESRSADLHGEGDHGFRRFPDEPFPFLAADFHGFTTVTRAVEAMPRFEFDRIAKIDDVRYRVDFAPFAAPMNEHETLINVSEPKVTEWSLVLRSDLHWVPEESKIVQQIQRTAWRAPETYERQISQRFRREGRHVLVTERTARGGDGIPPFDPVASPFSNHLYAYDIDPEYEERIFDPQSLDLEPWPARRELPWLPWHAVTFLLGCGLAVALIARRISFRSRVSTANDGADGAGKEFS